MNEYEVIILVVVFTAFRLLHWRPCWHRDHSVSPRGDSSRPKSYARDPAPPVRPCVSHRAATPHSFPFPAVASSYSPAVWFSSICPFAYPPETPAVCCSSNSRCFIWTRSLWVWLGCASLPSTRYGRVCWWGSSSRFRFCSVWSTRTACGGSWTGPRVGAWCWGCGSVSRLWTHDCLSLISTVMSWPCYQSISQYHKNVTAYFSWYLYILLYTNFLCWLSLFSISFSFFFFYSSRIEILFYSCRWLRYVWYRLCLMRQSEADVCNVGVSGVGFSSILISLFFILIL